MPIMMHPRTSSHIPMSKHLLPGTGPDFINRRRERLDDLKLLEQGNVRPGRKSIQRTDISSGLLRPSPTNTNPTTDVDGVLMAVVRPSANRSGKRIVDADFYQVVDGGSDARPAECHGYRSGDTDAATLRMQERANARLHFHIPTTAGRKRGEFQQATVHRLRIP